MHGPWELSFPRARDQGRLDTTHLVHNSYLEEKRAKVDEELGAWLEYGQIGEVRSHISDFLFEATRSEEPPGRLGYHRKY